MFVFLVRSSQVGWSVIHDLLDQEVGVERGGSEKILAVGWQVITEMG